HVHEVHIEGARAHVFRRYVPATQTVNESTVRTEQHLALLRAVVPDHDGFSAAEVQPGDGVLVGHPSRKTVGIHDGGLVRLIAPEPRSTQRSPSLSIVNR